MKLFVYYSRKWNQLYLGDASGTQINILNYVSKPFTMNHSFLGKTRVPKGTMIYTMPKKIPATYILIGEYN